MSPDQNQPSRKASFGGLVLLQISLHDHVAAKSDLALGFAVQRNGFASVSGFKTTYVFLQLDGRHALAGLQAGAFIGGQVIPFGLPGADNGWPINFGQAIDLGDIDAQRFSTAAITRRRRRGEAAVIISIF